MSEQGDGEQHSSYNGNYEDSTAAAASPYVAVRLRPFLSEDVGWNCVIVGGEQPPTSVTLHNPSALAVDADPEEDTESTYAFSRVFNSLRRPEESTRKQAFCCNEAIWDQVGEPCLRRCLEGQASTLLVCGQTGSGKSHSIVGHTEGMGNTIGHDTEEGILPRLFEALFKVVDDNLDDHCVFEVEFGWVELRGEVCYDLLSYAPKRPSDRPLPLGVFEHPSTGAHVRGQAWMVVNTLLEASEMLDTVMTMRALRSTRWGDHGAAGVDAATLIATVRVTQTVLPDTTKPGVKANDPKQYVVGTVRVVELGGLEALPSAHKHDVHAVGDDALVGCSMAHHSLRNLARCFHVLSQIKGAGAGQTKEQASQLRRQAAELVPWRDAVLTLLLRDALLSTIGVQMSPREPAPRRRAAKHGSWVNSESRVCEEQLRMLLCISPASDDHDATLAALKFADRVCSLGSVKSSPNIDGGPEDKLPGYFYVRQVGTFIDAKDKNALANGPAMHTSMLLRREVKRLEARLERAKDHEQQARDAQAEAAKSRHVRAKTLVSKTKPPGIVTARREAARAADSKYAEQGQNDRQANKQVQIMAGSDQPISVSDGASMGKDNAQSKSTGKVKGKVKGKGKGKVNKRQKSRAAIPMNKKEQQEKQEADRRQRLHEAIEEQKAQEQKQVDDDIEVEERFERRQFEEQQLQLRLSKDAARQRAGMSSLECSDTARSDASQDDIAALVSARKTIEERLEQIKGVQTAWLSRERPSGARVAESKKLWTKRRRALEWAGLMAEGDEKAKSQALIQERSSAANGGNVPAADAQRAAATSTGLVSSRGKRAASDPHLELLHRDMSLSGRALFFCQLKGETVIGFADGEDYNDGLLKIEDDQPANRVVASFDASGRMKVGKAEAQKRLHIILGGPELIGKHCIIRYNAPKRAWKTGSITLQVLKRPGVTNDRGKNAPDKAGEDDQAHAQEETRLRTRVFLNGRALLCQEDGGSMTYALHHGDRLVLGYYNVLRVVHPHEADVLRQRAEGALDELSSELSELSDDGDEDSGEEKGEGTQKPKADEDAAQGPHADRKPDEWNWLYAMEEVFAAEIETMSHRRTEEEEKELQHRRWLHEQEAVAKQCNWDIDGVVDKDGDGNPKHRPAGAPVALPGSLPRDTHGNPEVASEDEDEHERKHDAADDNMIDSFIHGSSDFALKWQQAGTPDDRVLGCASVHGHPSSVRKLHNQRNHVDAVLIAEELSALASEVGRLVKFRAYHEDFDEADVQGMTTTKAAEAVALWQGKTTAKMGNNMDTDAADGAGHGTQPRNADSFVMCEIQSVGPTATPRPPIVWCLDKAYNRLALCREMYTAFVCDCSGDLKTLDGEVDKYTLEQGTGFWPSAEDPFDDIADEQLLGKAEVFPRALSKLLPVHEQVPVINYAGREQGTLTVGITPYVHPGEAASGPSRDSSTSKPVPRRRIKATSKQGGNDRADMLRRHSQELEAQQAFARGWVMSNSSVDEQTDMIDAFRSGKRGHADIRFAVYIRHAAGLNPRLRHRTYVTYRLFQDYEESFSEQCPLPTTHPRWRYAGSHPCPRAGKDLLEYVSHGSVVFHVWGFPDTAPLQNPPYGHRATALHGNHVNIARVSVTQLLVPRPPTLAESERLEARCEDSKRLLENIRVQREGYDAKEGSTLREYLSFKSKVDAEEAKTKKRWEHSIGKQQGMLEKSQDDVKKLRAEIKQHSHFCAIQ